MPRWPMLLFDQILTAEAPVTEFHLRPGRLLWTGHPVIEPGSIILETLNPRGISEDIFVETTSQDGTMAEYRIELLADRWKLHKVPF